MKYYKLIYDYENDDDYIYCELGECEEVDEYATIDGNRVNEWSQIIFKYDPSEGDVISDYVANEYMWLLMSNKFCELTKDMLSYEVQYLPVKLIDVKQQVESDDFKIINIVNLLDALDLEKSEYSVFKVDDKEVLSIKKYALKSDVVENNNIFRLLGETTPVFVSEQVKNIIEKNNLLGFAFLEVEVM